MVCKVVDDRDAARDTADFHTPSHTLICSQAVTNPVGVGADRLRRCNRGEAVADIESTGERRLDSAPFNTVAKHTESRELSERDVDCAPFRIAVRVAFA